MPDPELLANPLRDRALTTEATTAPRALHRTLPGYAPTPLVAAPRLAAAAGVGEVWLKAELERFGLPAFKALGASWAALRLLGEEGDRTLDDVRARVAGRDVVLVTATDGNHGRGVAFVARLLGLPARVLVPAGTAAARIAGIAAEGARVEVVDGDYDEAVRRAAALADDRHVVLSDTSWPGYAEVPRWVAEGYATIFAEADEQLAAAGARPPDLVVVPFGVGALAQAAVRHHRRAGHPAPPRLLGVEPRDAACGLASARAGRIVTVPGPHRSIMAGLNCGTPSPVAWPDVAAGFDAFCAIDDETAADGVRALAAMDVPAGEVSGGTAGALIALRGRLGLAPGASVLLLLTEGITDPEMHARLVGRPQ